MNIEQWNDHDHELSVPKPLKERYLIKNKMWHGYFPRTNLVGVWNINHKRKFIYRGN